MTVLRPNIVLVRFQWTGEWNPSILTTVRTCLIKTPPLKLLSPIQQTVTCTSLCQQRAAHIIYGEEVCLLLTSSLPFFLVCPQRRNDSSAGIAMNCSALRWLWGDIRNTLARIPMQSSQHSTNNSNKVWCFCFHLLNLFCLRLFYNNFLYLVPFY